MPCPWLLPLLLLWLPSCVRGDNATSHPWWLSRTPAMSCTMRKLAAEAAGLGLVGVLASTRANELNGMTCRWRGEGSGGPLG